MLRGSGRDELMERWLRVETDRLVLRAYCSSDEAHIHEYASDPEVVRYASWGPNDAATTRAFLEGCLKQQEQWPRDSVEIAIELKQERRMIGGCGPLCSITAIRQLISD